VEILTHEKCGKPISIQVDLLFLVRWTFNCSCHWFRIQTFTGKT